LDKIATSGNPGCRIALASSVGQLLALCARDARDAGEAERCWSAATGILDRLCDVGASERQVPGLTVSRRISLGGTPGSARRTFLDPKSQAA
jgi:hypothetical protein